MNSGKACCWQYRESLGANRITNQTGISLGEKGNPRNSIEQWLLKVATRARAIRLRPLAVWNEVRYMM